MSKHTLIFWFLFSMFGLKPRLAWADEKKGASGADGKGSADTTDDQDDPDTSGGSGKNTVAYDTYKKTLSEAKQAKAKLKELEEKMASFENDKLSAEGKKDELIAKYKTDLDKISKTHKDTLNSFVFQSLDAQVRETAASMGCIDVDAVGKLVDLSDLEVDTKTFKADKKAVAEVIEGLKKSKPYLFNKAGSKINTKMPNGAKVEDSGGKKLKDMSKDEILIRLRQLEQQ